MPFEIEHEGETIKVWTQEEVDSEVKGLKVTNANLKTEKQEVEDKLRESKENSLLLEEAKAKAEGDKETLQRIADERAAEKDKRINELINSTRREKVANAINTVVTEMGAGGSKNEDLRDLLSSRYEFDYDIDSAQIKVSGDGVASIDELKNVIKTSGRYDSYLAGSGASGGGATGGKGTGVTTKKFNEYTGEELKTIRNSDPQLYDRLKNEYNSQ